jgi:hypothetical protein
MVCLVSEKSTELLLSGPVFAYQAVSARQSGCQANDEAAATTTV